VGGPEVEKPTKMPSNFSGVRRKKTGNSSLVNAKREGERKNKVLSGKAISPILGGKGKGFRGQKIRENGGPKTLGES